MKKEYLKTQQLQKEFYEEFSTFLEGIGHTFDEHFVYPDDVWQFIKEKVIPACIEDMNLGQKKLPYNIKVFTDPENHIKEIETFAKDEGFNEYNAEQIKRGQEIINKLNI